MLMDGVKRPDMGERDFYRTRNPSASEFDPGPSRLRIRVGLAVIPSVFAPVSVSETRSQEMERQPGVGEACRYRLSPFHSSGRR